MGNTLNAVTENLCQDAVLPSLKLGLLPTSAFSVKLTREQLKVGSVETVPVLTAGTAAAYGGTFETGDSTATGVPVTITTPLISSWHIDPNVDALPTMDLWLAMGAEKAKALAKLILQNCLAKFVTANIGNTNAVDALTITSANYDRDDQADQWVMLKNKKVAGNISAIHNIAYAGALFKDVKITDKSASGSDVGMTGELPSILGCRQFFTDAFPTALTNENVGVIFTGSESVALAIGPGVTPVTGLEQASGVIQFPVTDPETGLTFMWRQWVNSATGVYWGSVYAFTGVAFLRNSATRILSA